MTDRELFQMALDALEHLQTDIEWQYKSPTRTMLRKVEKALRARLKQPEPWVKTYSGGKPNYTQPIEREPILPGGGGGSGEPTIDGWPLYSGLPQPEPERYTTDAVKVRQAVSEAVLQQSEQGPIAYLCENAVGHKYFRWKKPPSTYKPIALYTEHAAPQLIWQGLTDEEVVDRANAEVFAEAFARGVAWAELKLREKNG